MSAFVVSEKTMQQVAFAVLHMAAGNFGNGEYTIGETRFHTDATDKRLPLDFGAFIADHETTQKASEIGRKLFALNISAVRYRYPDDDCMADAHTRASAHWFKFNDDAGRCSIVQAYKSVRCLMYQCAEGEYDKTPLFRDLQRLSDDLAHDIATRLPEWDSAQWDAA